MLIQTTERLSGLASDLRASAYNRQEGFEYLGSHRRIHFVDLAELTCDISIADCIKEVAENRVRLRMHVGAFVVPLQRLKFIDRVLLGHGVLDLTDGEHKDIGTMYFVFAICGGLHRWHHLSRDSMELQQPGLQIFTNTQTYNVFMA